MSTIPQSLFDSEVTRSNSELAGYHVLHALLTLADMVFQQTIPTLTQFTVLMMLFNLPPICFSFSKTTLVNIASTLTGSSLYIISKL